MRQALILLSLAALSCGGGRFLCQMPDGGDTKPLAVESHTVSFTVDPADHSVELCDSIRFSGSLVRFELNAGLELKRMKVNGRKVPLKRLTVKEPAEVHPGARRAYLLTCPSPQEGLLVIHAEGEVWQDPASMRFGHETVGNELQASVGDEGFWFSPESGIVPILESTSLPEFSVTGTMPADWSFVTQGRLTLDEVDDDEHVMRWEGEIAAEGVSLMGGPYDIVRETVEGVEISTWFFRRDPAAGPFMGHAGPVDDAQVKATLLRMSGDYLRMYNDLLGPYPFSKFAVVESFFPAGYGMPSWTLLGSHVIRMPYIPYTSLGHELLHNYWGNGVMVDLSEGNWCEGITVFDADYRYKALQGPEAAREYRKNTLKDYRSYVHGGSKDLPLSAFTSRHDGATRSIGYGKSMMVYHMLDLLLGEESFRDTRRRFYAEYTGKLAKWSDLMRLAAEEGRMDLDIFADQWLKRTGAPSLAIGSADWQDGKLTIVIQQTQQAAPYELDVPVRIECHDGTVLNELVFMDTASSKVELACSEPRKVTVDPDYDIFRLLDGREVEPVISMVMAESNPLFVAPASWLEDDSRREALVAFSSGIKDLADAEWVAEEDFDPATLGSRSIIGINLNQLPEGLQYVDLRLGEDWQLNGERHARSESNLVLATRSATSDTKGALLFWISSEQSLPFLARKVPHYGKYSYLAFDNEGSNFLKANLSPAGNPLEMKFGSW